MLELDREDAQATTASRRQGGRRAQQYGSTFERIFERACLRVDMAVTRIPQGCIVVGGGRRRRPVLVSTDFDWVISHGGRSALLDTKTTIEARLTPSFMTEHQVDALHAHALKGVAAGYVIWFRLPNQVVYVTARALRAIQAEGKGRGPEHFVQLGPIETFDPRRILAVDRAPPPTD